MRPDKKKKVHHDSQKAKNRALASNNNSGEDKKPKIKKIFTHNNFANLTFLTYVGYCPHGWTENIHIVSACFRYYVDCGSYSIQFKTLC